MIYRFTKQFDANTFMVPCGVTFLEELAEAVRLGLIEVTNLGQLGDSNHNSVSRHSRHAYGGKFWIAAFDLGGRDYPRVAQFWQAMWLARDPRIFRYGFAQRGDGYGVSWDNGAWHWTGSDFGHAHLDFAMASSYIGGQNDTGWWVPHLNSTAGWGFIHWLQTGQITPYGSAPSLNNESLQEDTFMPALTDAEQRELLDLMRTTRAELKAARGEIDQARNTAASAVRMAGVALRTRPAAHGEMPPALPAGSVEPDFTTALRVGESLTVNEVLFSANGSFGLVVQGDGNLVAYDPAGRAFWYSGTSGANAALNVQPDGNLVLYDGAGNVLWHTGAFRPVGQFPKDVGLVMQDDRNLVLYHDGKAVWASGTNL